VATCVVVIVGIAAIVREAARQAESILQLRHHLLERLRYRQPD
jgi:hypothetical protein